jgi:MarR family transcriptional regulator, lower aerobic nicotinate degradation pathway regulator
MDTDSEAAAPPVVAGQPPVLALSATPGHLLRRTQQVHTAMWAEYVRLQLTGPQYGVLASLAQEPLIDQTRLGELASLDKNNAADIVRRLTRRGWICRSVDPADQRRRVLELTPPAKVAMREITPVVQRVQDALLGLVPPGGRADLVRMLAAIAYQQGEPPSSASAPDEPPALSLARSPGYLIRRAQRVHGAIWARDVGAEITGPQYAVLVALASEPGTDQVTVGRLTSLDRSSTADIVARLVRAGWIRQERRPGYGRRSILSLTAEAEAALHRITPKAAAVQRGLLRPLSPPDAAAFPGWLAYVAFLGYPPTAT